MAASPPCKDLATTNARLELLGVSLTCRVGILSLLDQSTVLAEQVGFLWKHFCRNKGFISFELGWVTCYLHGLA